METYTVLPINKKEGIKAPVFYVDAISQDDAIKQSNKSALARFSDWKMHVIIFNKNKNNNRRFVKNVLDKNSKSQQGKLKTGHVNSRPVRRGLRRLSIASSSTEKGCIKAGAIKMW